MIVSNLGNSSAGVYDSIRAEERIDWSRGIRQAELTYLDRQAALRMNSLSARKKERDIQLKQEQIIALKRVLIFGRFIPLLSTYLSNVLENLIDEIKIWEESKEHSEALWRDCVFELQAAQQEKERILQKHPEALHMTYEQLQKRAELALREKKLAYIKPRYWAARNNLPESVGAALFDASDEERDYLISRITQDLYGTPVPEEVLGIAQIIAKFPVEEQKRLLQGSWDTVQNIY